MTPSLGPNCPIDLPTLVDTRLLVQANSGGGKSYAVRRLLEQTHGKVQHLVIDPEGEFASLREHFDYVLAGKGGDCAADPRTARLLAERLLELGCSAILDIYELKAHERVRFVREFLEALIDAPKKLWHPALVVVDEAHVYAPQVGEAESAGAVKDLATRGRKRGFCAVLATQRLSKLHKDAAAECNNKLIGRTGLDVDLKRAVDELGMGKDEGRALRTLEPGEFYAYGPALSKTVQRVKVGPVRTTHPKAGARLATVAPPPSSKVKALLPRLADLPAEVEQKKVTEEGLRAEIKNLKFQLSEKFVPVSETKIVEVPAVDAELADRLRTQAGIVKTHGELLEGLGRDVIAALDRVARSRQTATPSDIRRQAATKRPAPSQADAPYLKRRSATTVVVGEGLTGPEQRILDAIRWMNDIGVPEPETTAVAFLAGYTPTGGAFCNPKGRLRVAGLIEYRGNHLVLTRDGLERSSGSDGPVLSEELHRRILDRLPGPEQRILRPLLEAFPEHLSNEELARAAGYAPTGGAYGNPRGRLRTLGLIEYRDGLVRARDILFPGAGSFRPEAGSSRPEGR